VEWDKTLLDVLGKQSEPCGCILFAIPKSYDESDIPLTS